MKTIEETKHQIAVEKGYKNWFSFTNHCWQNMMFKALHDAEDEVAEAYAEQCCNEQIQECCNNATVKQESEYIDCSTGYAIVSRIDEDSILSTPNVVTTKP